MSELRKFNLVGQIYCALANESHKNLMCVSGEFSQIQSHMYIVNFCSYSLHYICMYAWCFIHSGSTQRKAQSLCKPYKFDAKAVSSWQPVSQSLVNVTLQVIEENIRYKCMLYE